MEIIADLHIHSKYSRATSKNLDLNNLVKYARIKGINLLGTGDFTHPKWISELKQLEDRQGVQYYQDFPFIFSTEVSLIYTQERGRRVHLIILAPNIEIVEQINEMFSKRGRLDYDGRPIFKIPCPELTENLISISKEIEIIPAHAWTPWFGIFGSMSGFDSLKEAFSDKAKYIHAIETGMSSNPEMNWHISELNEKSIVSFSDAHSFWPLRIGREATIFDLKELNYKELVKAIRENTIKATIETSPLYGKYHWDGHRICNFSCSPEESIKLKGICPVCHKPLVIGVENRVSQLTDQKIESRHNKKPFYTLLPLQEIIAAVRASTPLSKKSWEEYNKLLTLGSEFDILLKVEKEKLSQVTDNKMAEIIMLNREGKIKVKPGYDGVYGEAILGEKQAKLGF